MNNIEIRRYALNQAYEADTQVERFDKEIESLKTQLHEVNPHFSSYHELGFAVTFFIIGILVSWPMAFMVLFAAIAYIWSQERPIKRALEKANSKRKTAEALKRDAWKKYNALCKKE